MGKKNNICFLLLATSLSADDITWKGLGSSNNMNEVGNWNPQQIPAFGDNAIFNSVISNINKNPTESESEFVVSSFVFPKFSARANKNSKSPSRLRYFTLSGLIGHCWLHATTTRSARLQIVRARCKCVALSVPLGKINSFCD